ncbi:serine protease inhibitor A3N-like isoform X2 [Monodelphis domestica]|nr:serine protease inhibitor A3N-like isoform X2 [Monodelphis domestica]
MKPVYILGLIVAVFCASGMCFPNPEEAQTDDQIQEEQPGRINQDSSAISTSNTDFAFKLFKTLASHHQNKNILFSPLSISIAFALLSLGAQGSTQTQILESLRFNLTETSVTEIHRGFQKLIYSHNLPNDMFQLSTGNALFVDKSMELLEKFQNDSKTFYSTEVFSADFQDSGLARQYINDYIKKQTQGKIMEMFKSLDENTIMVLVNYIYFKAKWKTPFKSIHTSEQNFFVSEDKIVQVPMMNLDHLYTRVFHDKELFCTVVELPYKGNATALFILPDEKKMEDVENSLNPEVLEKWKNSLKKRQINLFLPKFSLSSDFQLEEILPTMGIEEVFTDQANLSAITRQRNLKVSKVLHKAVVDVDETGTEAAVATGIEFVLYSAMFSPEIITFNRPFFIYIYHEEIIFMGKVVNPIST